MFCLYLGWGGVPGRPISPRNFIAGPYKDVFRALEGLTARPGSMAGSMGFRNGYPNQRNIPNQQTTTLEGPGTAGAALVTNIMVSDSYYSHGVRYLQCIAHDWRLCIL